MTHNPLIGNKIIIISLALVIAIMSLFTQWGVITLTQNDIRSNMTVGGQAPGTSGLGNAFSGVFAAMLTGMKVPVTGTTGHLQIGPLQIPYWLGVLFTGLALVITALNMAGFSDFPRKALIISLLIGGAIAVCSVCVLLIYGSLGIGGLLLIVATVMGFTQVPRWA